MKLTGRHLFLFDRRNSKGYVKEKLGHVVHIDTVCRFRKHD